MTDPTLRSLPPVTLSLTVDPNFTGCRRDALWTTPHRHRHPAGPSRARNSAAPCCPRRARLLLLRRDGILQLDVRIMLKTSDDHLIYMSYRGMRHGRPWVSAAHKGERSTPASTISAARHGSRTSSEKYRFPEPHRQRGHRSRRADGPVYRCFRFFSWKRGPPEAVKLYRK